MNDNSKRYIPLSGNDLLRIWRRLSRDDPPNIYIYKDIQNKSLDDILGGSQKAIILFMTRKNTGHWCALWRTRGKINFFDSYGNAPDDQYKFIPTSPARRLNGDIRGLTRRLFLKKRGGDDIIFNEHELQNWSDPQMATCGRWCIVRLMYPNISVSDFNKIFKNKNLSPDLLVTALTEGN